MNRVSEEKGEGRKKGARLFQIQSMTVNITGVSSSPLVETTENNFLTAAIRERRGLPFYYLLVLISKARMVGPGDGQ